MSKRVLILAVCCLGVSALMTQLTLMRELLSVFAGNELVFGIVLGNWLLLTGIGSALGATGARLKAPLLLFVAAEIVVAVLPLADVFLLRTLRNVVFLRGAEIGVTETVVSCFVLLAPYCLTTGYLLTLASLLLAAAGGARRSDGTLCYVCHWLCQCWGSLRRKALAEPVAPRTDPAYDPSTVTHYTGPGPLAAAEEGSASIGLVYFLDNLGSVVGGLLFSFVLIRWFGHFGILLFPALLNLLLAAWLAVLAGKRMLAAAAAAVALLLAGVMAGWDVDGLSTAMAYPGQRVVFHGHSPYGSLVVTEAAGQFNFIESGVVLFSTHNVEEVEESVHYAMAQRPRAERVLLISGGVSGTAREILKYGVRAVDYVELDPLILRVAVEHLPESLADPRIEVINTDDRLFVKQTDRHYDVVIVDVPNPSTSQLNRFYTREFFAEVSRVLAPGGVLCFSLANYEDYLSKELADLIAVAHRTASSVFRNVLILPGGRVFFLASDGPLTADVARQIEEAGVQTRLVNRHYLDAMLSPDRLAEIGRALSDSAAINTDFNPILYYYHLRYWMSHFRFRFGLLEGILVVVLAVYLLRIRSVPMVVFSAGFAASALEVVLLVAAQVLNGCLYYQAGLIITMFMLGLGIGSFVMNRRSPRRPSHALVKLALVVAAYAMCLPPVLIALGSVGAAAAPVASQLAVPLLTLLLAVLVGAEFPLAGKIEFHGTAATAARLYLADFIGAALGALLVSTLLLPVAGVVAVCLLSAGANVFAAARLLVTLRRGGN